MLRTFFFPSAIDGFYRLHSLLKGVNCDCDFRNMPASSFDPCRLSASTRMSVQLTRKNMQSGDGHTNHRTRAQTRPK